MSQTELHPRIDAVRSRSDLVSFIQELSNNLKTNPEQWANVDLYSYLESMSAWIADMDGYYEDQRKVFSEEPSWKTFAEILYASTIYE